MNLNTSLTVRGIAILLVLANHLLFPELAVLGALGIGIFLFVSGYGLYARYGLANIPSIEFTRKRIRRVAMPLWMVLSFLFIYNGIAYTLMQTQYFTLEVLLRYALNFALIIYKPFDVISVGWFITYIFIWYALFLLASLPNISARWKISALFTIPVLVWLSSASVASLAQTFLFAELGAFQFLNPLYALCFPLGVLCAHLKVKFNLDLPFLKSVGNISYWLYLIHVPALQIVRV